MTTETLEPIDPSKTALLIMDYQNGIIPMATNPEELLAGARQAIDLIRSHGGTIGYVRVGFADASEIGGSMGKRVGGPAAALEHFQATTQTPRSTPMSHPKRATSSYARTAWDRSAAPTCTSSSRRAGSTRSFWRESPPPGWSYRPFATPTTGTSA